MTRSPVTDFKAVKNDTEVEGNQLPTSHCCRGPDHIRTKASDRATFATALRLYAISHGWRSS